MLGNSRERHSPLGGGLIDELRQALALNLRPSGTLSLEVAHEPNRDFVFNALAVRLPRDVVAEYPRASFLSLLFPQTPTLEPHINSSPKCHDAGKLWSFV